MSRRVTLGKTTIILQDLFCLTVLPEGVTLPSVARDLDADYRERARSLGYPNADAMNRYHDLAHALVAHWLGQEVSPALRAQAKRQQTGKGEPAEWHEAEEAAVLAIQRLANVWGVDLFKVAQRYGTER